MNIISIISVMLIVTFSIRAFSLMLFSGRTLPPLVMRALSLVPIAILSAICSPLIFLPEGTWTNPVASIEFWAALSCVASARYGMIPAILVSMTIYVIGKLVVY